MKALSVSRKIINNVKTTLRERRNMAGEAGSVMPISVTTARLVNVLKTRVARNPIRPMRAMAHDIRVSEVMV